MWLGSSWTLPPVSHKLARHVNETTLKWSTPFLSFILPIFAWNVPLVSLIFLKRSLVLPIELFFFFLKLYIIVLVLPNIKMNPPQVYMCFLSFFALITEERFLISPCYSLELCIQMGISFLFPLLFASFLVTAICKASSDSHFAFLHFFFLGMVLIHASCTMSQTPSIVLEALCLSDLIPWIYLSLSL